MADATGVHQYSGSAVQSALSAGITNASLTFSIIPTTNWPDGSIGNFVATADPNTSLEEKMLCSGLAGGVLTVVTRGYDGTTAVAHASGAVIIHTVSAIDLAEANWIANFHARTSKATPVDADELPLADSAATFGLKKLTWANIKATLKTYFDPIYARFNGATVSAKTASYILVAADVGTRVTMNAAGATAITVNTSLFAAGDTLILTNIGAGACTITAGTATVSTASSLVLAQFDSGRLYFTSTGVAIWEKFQGAGIDSTAWTAYTPTVTAETGTITTYTAVGRYKVIGKTCFVSIQVTLTTVGTATGYMRVTLPFTSHASAINSVGMARDSVASGISGYLLNKPNTNYADSQQVTPGQFWFTNGYVPSGTLIFEVA